jgi:hypothetical protein
MRIRTLALAAVAAVTLGVTALSTATASAAAPAPATSRSCVMNVANGTTACYSSFTTALSVATAGKITNAPDNAAAAVRDESLATRLNAAPTDKKKTTTTPDARAAASIVIGIEYDDTDFDGSSLIYSATAGCTSTTSDVDWQAASLPSGWNDEIESYRTYANCWAKHYLHANFNPITWIELASSSIQSMSARPPS